MCSEVSRAAVTASIVSSIAGLVAVAVRLEEAYALAARPKPPPDVRPEVGGDWDGADAAGEPVDAGGGGGGRMPRGRTEACGRPKRWSKYAKRAMLSA